MINKPKGAPITLILTMAALSLLAGVQLASAREPLSQHVCLIDTGPIQGQIALASAPTSPGMNSPCSPEGPVTLNADGSINMQGLTNTGRVVFEHAAGLRQYVCRFDSGPLAGQLALFSRSTPPAVGEACGDSVGNGGVVLFVEE
jgi:hypothetical protein